MVYKQNTGEHFLHERDPRLHSSREVEDVVNYLRRAGDNIPNEPAAKIKSYLGFLASKDYVNDGILTGNEDSIQRQIELHITAVSDVPEAYFELQQRIVREQGHGHVDITPDIRRQLVEAVQADQLMGLNNWIEYLGGDDGSYPDWFKYYTFESVTRLGSFDKEKQQFNKRSRGTTSPYPELNREALAYVYDNLVKARVHGGEVDDTKLGFLLQNANFGQLYARAMLTATLNNPELLDTTIGSWTKYDQTGDPRTARQLSGSLQGHGTGWCTAGESTASKQLQVGDFYVYYTRDDKGKDTIPRVAIRMQNGSVAEVRGINADQNLEGEVADIAMDKLRNLSGGLEYQKKADDMKRLTEIEKIIDADGDVELSTNDIKFLYEVQSDIQGFGYERDPRIDEIKKKRGERDMGEIKSLLIEVIREQAASAYAGFDAIDSQFNDHIFSQSRFDALLQDKMTEWADNGVYDFVTKEFISGGGRPNLVATPNIVLGWKDLRRVAERFSEAQPYETYIYNNLYERYSARELSGDPTYDIVRFSLIPSRNTPRLGCNSVKDQRRILAQMQSENHRFHLYVPSILEAITYWYTLLIRGDKLAYNDIFGSTNIKHFNLHIKGFDTWLGVPLSYIGSQGEPCLTSSPANYSSGARVAVR